VRLMDGFTLPHAAYISVFESIITCKAWGSDESVSGYGSTVASTAILRRRLAEVFAHLQIRSLVDAPCGDMNWMRHLEYKFDKYIGIDLVPRVIEKLRQEPFSTTYHFQIGNIVTDVLPIGDALFCRDCLVHLPFSAIHEALRLWRIAEFKFIIMSTFPSRTSNSDCMVGDWRPLNMELPPFNWPKSLMILS
jgi:hypothetical protein